MPILRNLDPPRAVWCNLRQALQWLRDETVPVEGYFERALGEDRNFREEDYRSVTCYLFGVLMEGRLPLYGRPGIGSFKDDRIGLLPIYQWSGYDDYKVTRDANGRIHIWFDEYGDRENIPTEKIASAGLQGLDLLTCSLTHIETFDKNENPERAWQYTDVVIATADLLREFPSANPPKHVGAAPKTAFDTKTRTAGRPTEREAVLARFEQKYSKVTPAYFARRGRYLEVATELVDELKLNEKAKTVANWISQHVRGHDKR